MCCPVDAGIPQLLATDVWGPDVSAYWLRTARPCAGLMIGETSDFDAVYVATDAGERVVSVARPLLAPIPAGAVIRPVLTRGMSLADIEDATLELGRLEVVQLPTLPTYALPTARSPRYLFSDALDVPTTGGGGVRAVDRWVTGRRVATFWVKEEGAIGLSALIVGLRPVGGGLAISKELVAETVAASGSQAWVLNLDTDPLDYLYIKLTSADPGNPTTAAFGFEMRD